MNRRVNLVATLKKAFTIDSSNKLEYIVGFLLVFISAGWFINNTATPVSLLGEMLFVKVGWIKLATLEAQADFTQSWIKSLAGIVFPTLALAASLWYVWRLIRHEVADTPARHLAAPPPLPGLILMLSPYNSRPSQTPPPYGDGNGVVEHLYDEDFREKMLRSRWGPLIVAAQHHASQLKHCWIVCTPGEFGSAADFPIATRVIQKFAPEVECHDVKLLNPNDVSLIAPQMSAIYNQAPTLQLLEPYQIIADFTSGTAAMSGGMLLATVEDDRRLEYLRQDSSLFDQDGKAFSPEQLAKRQPLVTILTTPSMVTSNQKRAS